MKKLVYILLTTLLLTACGTYKSLNLNRLTTGMTKSQVESIAGRPDRILAVNETPDGYQEVLEYSTSYGEIYALEFWNDYLTGYEYIDNEVTYVPVPTPPAYYPDYGRPIIVIPGRPNRPSPPPSHNRPPATRPPSTSRPPSNTRPPSTSTPSRPTQRPTTKPAEGSRPVGTPNNSRPSNNRQESVSGGRSSSSSSSQSSSGGRSSSSSSSSGSSQSSSGGGRSRTQ